MKYVLAFGFPPLAVLICGKPGQVILNLFLCLLWMPGVIHAVAVVAKFNADEQTAKQVAAINQQTKALLGIQAGASVAKTVVAPVVANSQSALPDPVARIENPHEKFRVARDGEEIGEYSRSDILKHLSQCVLHKTDCYFTGDKWDRVANFS